MRNIRRALREHIVAAGGPVRMTDRDRPQGWSEFAVGRTNFNLSAIMLRNGKQVRAELYIRGPSAKQHLEGLRAQSE